MLQLIFQLIIAHPSFLSAYNITALYADIINAAGFPPFVEIRPHCLSFFLFNRGSGMP